MVLTRSSLGVAFALVFAGATACGTSGAGGSTSTAATGSGGANAAVTGATGATGGPATGATGTSGSSSGSGSGSGGDVGVWTDAPGVCPVGLPQVDITTAAELASAARGQDAYTNDAPATCYLIHNGTYATTGAVLYVLKGGNPGGTRRYFIGESRAGVVIHGRGTIDDGVSDVTLSNLTMDLAGYSQSGSFNTLGIGASSSGTGKNITVDHVTFTGDCATGANGGHVEVVSVDGFLLEACIIEKFGRCGPLGHQDHGVYLANGKNIVIRNNLIRGNASRGIQFNTENGTYGTLDSVTIEQNRIYQNGHEDYEDGIVVNSAGTGVVSNVTIQHNILDHNYYSGIRFVGGMETGFKIEKNTFDTNGSGSTSANRSEVNIDSAGGGSGTMIDANIFSVGNLLINNCYDATTLGFSIGSNFVHGAVPSGAAGNCVTTQTMGDPQFTNAAGGDYHTTNPAAATFGAYAP